MTDNWGPEDLSELRRTICRQVRIKDAGQTATSMTLAHRPAPTSSHLHPTAAAAAGGKRSPTTADKDARLASLVTETAVAYFPEGRDAFIASGGKTCCDDDLIDDIIDARRRVGRQQQKRADGSKGQQAGENIKHYTGHADHRDRNEGHDDEHDDSRTNDDGDYDYVLDLRHPVVASWEDSREKEDGEDDGSIIDSAFGGELDDEDEDEDWEQVDDADKANDADDEDETDSDTDTDTTNEEDMPGGAYTLAAALALPYEVVDNDDDDSSEEDEETTGAKYVLAPEYAARFKIVEVDEEMEEVDWEDQSDLLAEWGSYSDYYDEYEEGERVKKKVRVV
ncbi:hypothetical protein DBV05_g6697 [Lasiodiplodia theobromae]|uniref:Uncharacterized protein n=1 Tax=Lasiodiplodia theobromae TaxID=45133 RepID=A0A5N5DAK1_9PEZI|nr:hypothetical protein DBV05_g6697 [Lasiodiplodia theobromae]